MLVYRRIEQGYTKDIGGNVIPYEYITTFTYNSKGRILTIDGPDAGTVDFTTLTYVSGTGNLLSMTQPVIGTTTYSEYDAAGRVGRVTDPNGNPVAYSYDGRGRAASITNVADGSVKYYDYGVAGELEQVTQPNGVTADFVYDATYGRLSTVVDPLGNTIQGKFRDVG